MKLLGLAVLAMAVSPAWAQFGSAGAPPTMSGWAHGPANSSGAMPSARQFPGVRSNLVFLGEPWLDSYPTQSGPVTYIVVQPQATVAAKPPEEAKPITPLLIEWHGDRFVRTTSIEPLLGNGSAAPQLSADYVQRKTEENPRTPKAANNTPVTLIYRDGHSEQVRDYSIIAGRLYTSADYVHSGSWMKAVSLSALNLPATIEANHEAGVTFVLPTAPNVVVTHF